MAEDGKIKKENKLKKFFSRFIDKLDKNMEEKAKENKGCCGSGKNGAKSCCS